MEASQDVTVSIITPCYNGSRFLRAALQSALEQTTPPLEVIVIDDGSTDDSARIAEGFGPPVHVIKQENRGESAARNVGVARARGTHVLFLDADDLLAPDALASLVRAVQNRPGAVALMGWAWFTTDPDSPHAVTEPAHDEFFPDIIGANFGPPNCWLVPRDLVLAAGGFCESMRWFEDWDLWWRVGLHASELRSVPYVGARYRQHAESQLATTHPTDRARGHAALKARMAAALLRQPALLARHGDRLFWSAWDAARRARRERVPWQEIAPLAGALRDLAHRGPRSVTASLSARACRLIGVRASLGLQGAWR